MVVQPVELQSAVPSGLRCFMCSPPRAMNRSASASVSVSGQRGVSPLQVNALRPVTERNCVLARGGGKHREVNDQSATKVNSIRPCLLASLLANGEARTGEIRTPVALKGSVSKRPRDRWGGWRRNGRKARHMKQRDLSGPDGVHRPSRRKPQCGCEEPPGRSQRSHSSTEAG